MRRRERGTKPAVLWKPPGAMSGGRREPAPGLRRGRLRQMERARRGGRGYDGVTDEQIYRRDKWVCLMPECACPDGQAINPSLTGTDDPWAPSIDHIVPLRAGGLDNARNKRAAHTKCNQLGDGAA